MPRKNRYITEEFLERRLDERFAEQAELIQGGFGDVEDRFGDVYGRIDRLEKKIDAGFGKLDDFLRKMNRLDEAEVMNQAAHRRFDDRLTALEPRPSGT